MFLYLLIQSQDGLWVGHLAPRLSWPSFAPYVVAHLLGTTPARGLSNAALAGLRDPRQAVEKASGRSAAWGVRGHYETDFVKS